MDEQTFRAMCEGEIGKPYIFGADGPAAYDCSGFVQWALKLVQLDPPGDQSADGLLRFFSKGPRGTPVADETAALLGDLVFYGTDEGASHVAIAWGDEMMIEAGGGGRKMTTVDKAKAAGACVRKKKITRRDDRIAIIRPTGLPW